MCLKPIPIQRVVATQKIPSVVTTPKILRVVRRGKSS